MVLPEASLGSMVIELTALMPKEPETYFQLGVPAKALFVRQIPPPAAAM
jgi:hypothetical protein